MSKMIVFDTPVESYPRLGADLGIDLRVKRDDLLPAPAGGNKVRKCASIFRDLVPNGVDTIITHGGAQSNHARIVAMESARRGLACVLVLHGDTNTQFGGNLLLSRLVGARIVTTSHSALWETVKRCEAELLSQGATPFIVPGGGHCLEGAQAYADAVEELAGQLQSDWTPDFIVHASGTGATQAGLLAGIERRQWQTVVVGISVGRVSARGKPIVEKCYHVLRARLGLKATARPVLFRDDWLCGGYEAFDAGILNTIADAAGSEGLLLDPTYTGKAFTGLRQLARSGFIPARSKVLFWHTGGLLNLVAAHALSAVAGNEPRNVASNG
jgi:1-aminocyclopropane-1-carboxylate deaminase/D-cysteine desulfhydrase-like pyridoxal-dependent ACC family enzyme